jgi:hypothetical protein
LDILTKAGCKIFFSTLWNDIITSGKGIAKPQELHPDTLGTPKFKLPKAIILVFRWETLKTLDFHFQGTQSSMG